MDQRSSGTTKTTKRGVKLGLLAGALTLVAGAVLPMTGADASKPAPGSPKKPAVTAEFDGVPTEITGEVTLSNGCGPGTIYCHTSISLLVKVGKKYIVEVWHEISSEAGTRTVSTAPRPGKNWYKTAMHDFESFWTGDECGPTTKRIHGVRYNRWSCGGGVTTYLKIYSSVAKAITVGIPLAI